MQLKIKATNLELTPFLGRYAEKKIKSLKRLLKPFEKEGEVYIYFELARTTQHHRSGNVFYAEANADLLGEKVRAESRQEDIRAAIDEVKDILKRQVKEIRGRQVDEKEERSRPGKPKK